MQEESTMPLKDVQDLIKTVATEVLDGLQVKKLHFITLSLMVLQ